MNVRDVTRKKFSVFLAGKEIRDKRKVLENMKRELELLDVEKELLEISKRIGDVVRLTDEHYILAELEPLRDINETISE